MMRLITNHYHAQFTKYLDKKGGMVFKMDFKECQNPECQNIGRLITAKLLVDGKEEIHEIYLCRVCTAQVSASNGGFKN